MARPKATETATTRRKGSSKTSPTQRTLKWVRDDGYLAAVTERWNAFAGIRQDLFGFIDVVAIAGPRTIGIQATSKSNMSARVKKILSLDAAKHWLLGDTREIWVVGWEKKGSRWQVAVRPVKREEFPA